jgi:hypothetical protein
MVVASVASRDSQTRARCASSADYAAAIRAAPRTRPEMRSSLGTRMRAWRLVLASLPTLGGACGTGGPVLPPFTNRLSPGTWGGDDAGVIVNDAVAHVHVGCTYGNFPAPVPLDQNGRFSVPGEYLLRAYPIAVGPTMPAQLAGVIVAGTLTLTVAVNDTVEHTLVVLGPVTVTYGRAPRMGPCPICAVPPLRIGATARPPPGWVFARARVETARANPPAPIRNRSPGSSMRKPHAGHLNGTPRTILSARFFGSSPLNTSFRP